MSVCLSVPGNQLALCFGLMATPLSWYLWLKPGAPPWCLVFSHFTSKCRVTFYSTFKGTPQATRFTICTGSAWSELLSPLVWMAQWSPHCSAVPLSPPSPPLSQHSRLRDAGRTWYQSAPHHPPFWSFHLCCSEKHPPDSHPCGPVSVTVLGSLQTWWS